MTCAYPAGERTNIIKYLFLICAVFDPSLFYIHSPQISNYLLIKTNQLA